MLLQLTLLIIGLILLFAGSSMLVQGAASTAFMFAVRPVIVGLTIVSFATSAPELLVSLVAAVKQSGGISLGNILGSNAINIALVLGISSIIKPVTIKDQIIKIEIPYMILISFIFWLLCMDSYIGRIDGSVLIVLFIIFLVYGVITAKDKNSDDQNIYDKDLKPSSLNIFKNIVFIILGILMLSFGANFVVREAIIIAQEVGLSQTFIGISVVALGTSLPELATSAVAAARGQSEISVGNVVGSNLFNICLVMGVVGIFSPMPIDENLHYFQFPFMLFICFYLGITAWIHKGVGKKEGFLLILLFLIYIAISYFN